MQFRSPTASRKERMAAWEIMTRWRSSTSSRSGQVCRLIPVVLPGILTAAIFAFTLSFQEYVYADLHQLDRQPHPPGRHQRGDGPRRRLLLGPPHGLRHHRLHPRGHRLRPLPRLVHLRHDHRRRQIEPKRRTRRRGDAEIRFSKRYLRASAPPRSAFRLPRTAIGSKARSFRSLTRRGSTLTTDCDRLHRTRRARGGADECSELESPERAESPRADAAEAADEEALRISAPVSA